jgi:DNA polymerase elongation subunit (family B)
MTSKIFIYSWELISRHPKIHIRAHFIEENPQTSHKGSKFERFERIGRLDITDFKVFCHINKFQLNQAIEASGIKPEHVKSYEARLSTDISKKEKYLTVYFSSAVNMERFCKFCRPRPLMSEINPLTLYLATNEYPRTGWFERQTQPTTIQTEFEGSINFVDRFCGFEVKGTLTHRVRGLKPLNITLQSYAKIACFDIECMCGPREGMPQPWRRSDTVEMISLVVKTYLDDISTAKSYLLYIGDIPNLSAQPSTSLRGTLTPCVRGLRGSAQLRVPSTEPSLRLGSTFISASSETDLFEKFAEVLISEDPDVITGYNIFGFDLSYILNRLKLRLKHFPNLGRGKDGKTFSYKVEWSSSAYGENVYDRVEATGRVFVDMILFFRRMKLESYSLNFVSKLYLDEGKSDVTPTEMWQAFETRDPESLLRVAKYCIRDSMLTLRLFDKFFVWNEVCEMSRAMHCSIEDIYTRGEQLKVFNQIVHECMQRDIVLVPRKIDTWKEYKGAEVIQPERGIYNGCSVLDFQSLYPSILIAYNICPSTYTGVKPIPDPSGITYRHTFREEPVGILPHLVKRLLDERKMVKATIKETSDPHIQKILDRRQNALKVCANSVYGITGFKSNKYFGHVASAESITGLGRQLLLKVVETIEEKYPEKKLVLYGDTDSVMLNCEEDLARQIAKDITAELPPPMALNFEAYYEKMLFMSKKRYIMREPGTPGVIKYKGVVNARRNYCIFVRNLYSEIVQMMLDDNSSPEDVLKYADKRILDLIKGKIRHEDLLMTKSVKALDSYRGEYSESLPQVLMAKRLLSEGNILGSGERLEYLFIRKVEGSPRQKELQGNKMYTPDEIEQKQLKIDYLYYLEKQIVPALDDLLEILGPESYLKRFHKLLVQNPH